MMSMALTNLSSASNFRYLWINLMTQLIGFSWSTAHFFVFIIGTLPVGFSRISTAMETLIVINTMKTNVERWPEGHSPLVTLSLASCLDVNVAGVGSRDSIALWTTSSFGELASLLIALSSVSDMPSLLECVFARYPNKTRYMYNVSCRSMALHNDTMD